MIEPLPYREMKDPVSWVMANVTLDGWTEAQWSRKMSTNLDPKEINEFYKVVMELIKLLPEYTALRKYMAKHGREIRREGMDATLAFTIDRPLLIYIMEATGPNVWIEAHRKEGL